MKYHRTLQQLRKGRCLFQICRELRLMLGLSCLVVPMTTMHRVRGGFLPFIDWRMFHTSMMLHSVGLHVYKRTHAELGLSQNRNFFRLPISLSETISFATTAPQRSNWKTLNIPKLLPTDIITTTMMRTSHMLSTSEMTCIYVVNESDGDYHENMMVQNHNP